MVCDGAGSSRTLRSTVRPASTGTTWMSATDTRLVAISARRKSSIFERLQIWQLYRREAILLTRVGGQYDLQSAARTLGARLDQRIIIALAAQQLREKVGVGARPAADLRGIGRILAVGLERGLLAERLEQV